MNERDAELVNRLVKNFGLQVSSDLNQLSTESEFFKYLQQKLAERITFFIRTDLDKLLQALYRIDVNDRDTDDAFALGKVEEVSMKLAELIIVRQLQKLDYSRKFHAPKKGGSN